MLKHTRYLFLLTLLIKSLPAFGESCLQANNLQITIVAFWLPSCDPRKPIIFSKRWDFIQPGNSLFRRRWRRPHWYLF